MEKILSGPAVVRISMGLETDFPRFTFAQLETLAQRPLLGKTQCLAGAQLSSAADAAAGPAARLDLQGRERPGGH